MKKTWNSAAIEVLNLEETAYGPYQPTTPDGPKTQVEKNPITGEEKTGWVETFGTDKQS